MRKTICAIAAGAVFLSSGVALAAKPDGKKLFETNCASCHKDGGNIINPQKTLKGDVLKKNGITKPREIVNKMRNPGPGMTKFDKKTLPDKDAMAIAEYVLKAFK